MSSVGTILETIRERRSRAGYREARGAREYIPPDYVERWARYPTASLLCFLAIVGGGAAAVALLIVMLLAANGPTGAPAAGPGIPPAVKVRR